MSPRQRIKPLALIIILRLKGRLIKMQSQWKHIFWTMSNKCYIPTTLMLRYLVTPKLFFPVQIKREMKLKLPKKSWKSLLTLRISINFWVEERELSKVVGGTESLAWTMLTLRTHQCFSKKQRKREILFNLKRTRSTTIDSKVSYSFSYNIINPLFFSFNRA